MSKIYHGDVFEGNACRELLKHANKLRHLEIYKEVGEFSLIPFIAAFNAMNKIVQSCFSSLNNYDDLDKHIAELSQAVKATGVSETLKQSLDIF